MLWVKRRAMLASMGMLALAGCFRPMLAEDSDAGALRGQVALPEVKGRFGYFLYQSLEERLGRPSQPGYRLAIEHSQIDSSDLAVAQDNTITRLTLTARVDWVLYRDGVPEPVLRESAVSQSGYSSTSSIFATRQTERDIERRLARDLGQKIARRILARAQRIETDAAPVAPAS